MEIRCLPVRDAQWSFYRVQHVMFNGAADDAPAVNSLDQAIQRARNFFPNATVTTPEGTL